MTNYLSLALLAGKWKSSGQTLAEDTFPKCFVKYIIVRAIKRWKCHYRSGNSSLKGQCHFYAVKGTSFGNLKVKGHFNCKNYKVCRKLLKGHQGKDPGVTEAMALSFEISLNLREISNWALRPRPGATASMALHVFRVIPGLPSFQYTSVKSDPRFKFLHQQWPPNPVYFGYFFKMSTDLH